MRTRLLLLACLCGAVPAQGQTPTPPTVVTAVNTNATLAIAWDASSSTSVTGYIVQRSDVTLGQGLSGCGPWSSSVDVGNVLTYTFAAGSVAATTPSCIAVRAYDAQGMQSDLVNTNILIVTPPDPRCGFPLGDRSVKIFATGAVVAGGRSRVDYQLASPNSPIVQLTVLLNGVVVSKKGLLDPMIGTVDLTNDGAQWFLTPTMAGTYQLQVQATNAYGCPGLTNVNAGGQPLTLTVVK